MPWCRTTSNASTGYIPVEDIRDGIVTPLMATYGDRFGGVFNWEFKSDTNFNWGNTLAEALFAEELQGDYDASGLVDQVDLDLVRSNWGQFWPPEVTDWVNDQPNDGRIDQDDLDRVLINWGNFAASVASSAVPEPTSAVLALTGILLFALRPR